MNIPCSISNNMSCTLYNFDISVLSYTDVVIGQIAKYFALCNVPTSRLKLSKPRIFYSVLTSVYVLNSINFFFSSQIVLDPSRELTLFKDSLVKMPQPDQVFRQVTEYELGKVDLDMEEVRSTLESRPCHPSSLPALHNTCDKFLVKKIVF